jgi:hypothetical protein
MIGGRCVTSKESFRSAGKCQPLSHPNVLAAAHFHHHALSLQSGIASLLLPSSHWYMDYRAVIPDCGALRDAGGSLMYMVIYILPLIQGKIAVPKREL